MKTTQHSRCAYFNVHTLIGLAAFGIALTAIVVFGAGRTGNASHQENGFLQFILHMEASPKRGLTGLMVPLMGAIMDTMLRQMQLATFSLLVGSKLQRGTPIPIP